MPIPTRAAVLSCLALMAVMAGGCATSYKFKVDAVRSSDPVEGGHSFKIVSANPEMGEGDLRFQEAARYVKTALSSKGMYEAPPGSEPEVIVEVDFGMGEPRTVYETVSKPVVVTTSGGMVPAMRRAVDPDTGKIVWVRTMVYEPPERRFTGETVDEQRAATVYDKHLRITARESPDQAGDRPPREIWSVYVTNEDDTSDLRDYLPLMVSVAMDSMDQNTNSQKEVVITREDKRVEFVKQGL